MTELVTPGTRLGHVDDFNPGEGTHVWRNHLYATVVGTKTISDKEEKSVLSVVKQKPASIVPHRGDVVTVQITRVNPRFAKAKILLVGDKAVTGTFPAKIRKEDVRLTDVDRVEIYNCFRPGDIVRAAVLSLGDSRNYFLTTAKNELGVIYAKSMAGMAMVPLNWETMECPKTKIQESRKVAKLEPV